MKVVFAIVDYLAILDIIVTIRAIRKNVRTPYGDMLRYALSFAGIAIFANVLIAVSYNRAFAGVAYSLYFASINGMIYFITGFTLIYTEHDKAQKVLSAPFLIIMGFDAVSILLNPLFGHEFLVTDYLAEDGTIFYQTQPELLYYIHLAIDYIALLITLVMIIYRLIKSYNIYRAKYLIILTMLLLVVALNIVYMVLRLPLDASVIFYGIGGTLIYFAIQRLVPRNLMMSSVARAIDDMNEGLILFDISNNCIYANAFSKNRFKMDEGLFSLESEPCAYVVDQLTREGESFGTVRYSQTIPGEEERIEHYIIRYNCLNDNRGRMIGTYFLMEDNTESVHYMEEIKKAKVIADEANQAKSSFIASMSHEIRTPLNSVLGMNEMILRSTEDPQLLEYAQNIKSSGDTLLNLISDILDYSKIEAKKMAIIRSAYNPHDILRECVGSFEPPAELKDLYIQIECDPNLPSRLLGDRKYIMQIFSNLLSNAVKYTKEGGVTVRMTRERDEGEMSDICISVSDTGIGISEADIGTLFDAFSRVNEKVNASIQGTGLGLAITKELVSLMDGKISVTSTPGKGSTFTVTLPQKVIDPTPLGEFKRSVPVPVEKYSESFRAKDAVILAVDDAKMNLKVIQALLKKTEIQIDIAMGGNEAIEKCRRKKYDLILLDHRMPDPDGIKTYCVISSEGANIDTPVIMLTANVVSGAEEDYKNLGFADYLAKPVRGEELEAALVKHLPPEKVILMG